MSINLQKGQKINLEKDGKALRSLMVGLGWDEARQNVSGLKALFASKPASVDCDASVILCGPDGKIADPNDLKGTLIYFGNLRHSSGAIVHMGDNLTGGGDGDDEQIMIDLPKVPSNIDSMKFVVNIYDARTKNQHFGMIQNAFIRIVDTDTPSELCRFNLTDDYSGMTGLVVGEIYRKNGEWKFNAIGQGVQEASRLQSLVDMFR